MLGYIKLLRPLNCLMAAIGVLIGGMLVTGSNFALLTTDLKIPLAMLVAFLISGAGNGINDYVDVEADKINKPNRPIPSKIISGRSALVFSIILFIIAIFLAGFLNWIVFFIAVINSILLIIYSKFLQDKILIGNIAVSYLVGSSFLFGGAALGNLFLPFLLLLLAGLANLSREIVKDLEDFEGDKVRFLKKITLSKIKKIISPIAERLGFSAGKTRLRYEKKLIIAAIISLFLAIIISPLPFILGILGLTYLVILIPTDIVFFVCALQLTKSHGKKGYHRISKEIKLGMLLGLIAFIMGILI